MTTIPREEYDLLDSTHLADPYPLYARLRREAPVHYSSSLAGWVLTRAQDVRRGLASDQLSADRFGPYLERRMAERRSEGAEIELFRGLAGWFTFADPPAHTRLRGLTNRVLSRPMKAMRPVALRMTREIVAEARARGSVDLIADVARPFSVGSIAELLGVPARDHDRITIWTDALTEFIGGALGVEARRQRAIRAIEDLNDYLVQAVRTRRACPTDDVIGGLCSLRHDGDALSDEEVVAIGAMLLFAGHGTTTNLIGNGMLALLGHPEQLAALREHPGGVPEATEELLRYDSPVQVTVRVAKSDGAMGIEPVCAGDRVFLFLAAANRDPAAHEEPDRLAVTRRRNGHLTFGHGVHFCLGAPLARIGAPIMLSALVESFPEMRLVVPVSELAWQPTVGFRGLRSLPVWTG